MANTYTKVPVEFVFAVKYRWAMVHPVWEADLYQYITGIAQHYRHKVLWIDGTEDHLHLFADVHPTQSLADMMQQVKGSASLWINDRGLTERHFEWQKGYGAFAWRHQDVPEVIQRLRKQEEHHSMESFLDEYRRMLDENGIPYDERYIFSEPEG